MSWSWRVASWRGAQPLLSPPPRTPSSPPPPNGLRREVGGAAVTLPSPTAVWVGSDATGRGVATESSVASLSEEGGSQRGCGERPRGKKVAVGRRPPRLPPLPPPHTRIDGSLARRAPKGGETVPSAGRPSINIQYSTAHAVLHGWQQVPRGGWCRWRRAPTAPPLPPLPHPPPAATRAAVCNRARTQTGHTSAVPPPPAPRAPRRAASGSGGGDGYMRPTAPPVGGGSAARRGRRAAPGRQLRAG